MAQQTGFLDTGNHRWHYLKLGHGNRVLLLFHGYGNSASIFLQFEKFLERDFTMYSFDLPHHGKSEWKGQRLVTKEDLDMLARVLMKQHNVKEVSLVGYSMGGRICLSLVEVAPSCIGNVLLIAPDGLRFNPLYYFVTKTFTGKRLFHHLLSKPDGYLRFLDYLQRKGWVATSRSRFVQYYLSSAHDREFLKRVWQDTSSLVPSQALLRKSIKAHDIPVFIFMGKWDTVIPAKHGKLFSQNLSSVRLFVVDKGHRVFDADTLPKMTQCLIKGSC